MEFIIGIVIFVGLPSLRWLYLFFIKRPVCPKCGSRDQYWPTIVYEGEVQCDKCNCIYHWKDNPQFFKKGKLINSTS